MKNYILLLFLPISVFTMAQVKPGLTPLEKKYLDTGDTLEIKGRVNRKVNPKTTNTYVVDYNFEEGVFDRNLLKVKVNTPVVFKISNINRLAYDIVVKGRDSALSVSFSIPEVESGREEIKSSESNSYEKGLEQLVKMVKESTNNFIENFSSEKSKAENLMSLFKDIEVKINKISSIEANLMALNNKKLTTENLLSNTSEVISHEKDTVKVKILKKNVLNMEDTIKEMTAEIQNLSLQETQLRNNIEQANKTIKAINNTLSEYKEKEADFLIKYYTYINSRLKAFLLMQKHQQTCLLAINDPFLTYDKFFEFKNARDLEKVKVELLSLVEDFKSLDVIYQEARDNYLIAKNVNLDGFFGKEKNPNQKILLNAQFTHLESLKKETDKYDCESIIFSLLQSIKYLEDPKNYTVESYPVQPTQDMICFDVTISQKNKENKINNSRTFKHHEYTYGGIRLDAGLGFAVTYLGNTPKYDLISNNSNEFTIAMDKKNYYSSSLIALFTATVRSNTYVSWGASAGIGVTIGDESTLEFNNYYLGGTAMFGKSDRFAITAGISLKQVDKLRAGYEVGSSIPTDDIDFTSEKITFGPFFSITYNLTKGLRDNIKEVKSFVSF